MGHPVNPNSLYSKFRDLPKECCVYALTHEGRDVYCGGTTNYSSRMYMHFYALIKGAAGKKGHKSSALQDLYNSVSDKTTFGHRIIERCDKEILLEREKFWTAQSATLLNAMPLGQKYRPEVTAKKSALAKKQMSDPEQYRAVVKRCAENSKKVAKRLEEDPEFKEKVRQGMIRSGEKHREKWKDPEYRARFLPNLHRRWNRV